MEALTVEPDLRVRPRMQFLEWVTPGIYVPGHYNVSLVRPGGTTGSAKIVLDYYRPPRIVDIKPGGNTAIEQAVCEAGGAS